MKFSAFWLPGLDIQMGKKCAKEAERLGYSYLWTFEQPNLLDVFTEAVVLSTVTKKIKIGPASVSPYFRHPAMIAAAAQSLDKISNGRAVLGIAAGARSGLRKLGLMYDDPVMRLRETIEVVKMMFTGNEVNYKGKTIILDKFQFLWAKGRDIPVYASVFGPKMLEMAGEVADAVMVQHCPPAYIDTVNEMLKKGAERKKRNIENMDISLHIEAFINEDYDEAMRIARTWFPLIAGGISRLRALLEKCGCTRNEIKTVQQDTSTLPKDIIDKILRNISIIGSIDDCIRKIKEYEDHGVRNMQINCVDREAYEWTKGNIDLLQGIELIGKEAIPEFNTHEKR
jgi:5,10-methylenetetrahydromethanopterin reductase